jgi:hypothetical protein
MFSNLTTFLCRIRFNLREAATLQDQSGSS